MPAFHSHLGNLLDAGVRSHRDSHGKGQLRSSKSLVDPGPMPQLAIPSLVGFLSPLSDLCARHWAKHFTTCSTAGRFPPFLA